MIQFRRLLGGLRALFHKKRVEQELDEELLDYIANATQQNMAEGMSRVGNAIAGPVRCQFSAIDG